MYEIHYVWQWPVRICHWINVIAMVMLSITGIYIGNPFMTAPDSSMYIMFQARALSASDPSAQETPSAASRQDASVLDVSGFEPLLSPVS